jgi:hypothetical protein
MHYYMPNTTVLVKAGRSLKVERLAQATPLRPVTWVASSRIDDWRRQGVRELRGLRGGSAYKSDSAGGNPGIWAVFKC